MLRLARTQHQPMRPELHGDVVVTYGDVPLLTSEVLQELVATHESKGNSVTVPISNNNLETPEGAAVEWDEEQSEQHGQGTVRGGVGHGRVLRRGQEEPRTIHQKAPTCGQETRKVGRRIS